jgi:hypothetical protein
MENDATGETGQNAHDLEQIKGIGPAFAEALRALGITRIADLLPYTPDQLAHDLLERAGVKVAADRIVSADWLGQAQELTGRTGRQASAAGAPEERAETDRLNWRQQAGFSIFFDYVSENDGKGHWQTRVYHDESGQQAHFTGVDADNWVAWVLARADLPQAAEASSRSEQAPEPASWEPALVEGKSSLSASIAAHDVWLDIVDLEVAAGTGGGRLVTRVDFRLAGEHAAELVASGASYQVDVQAVSLTGGSSHFVESELNRLEPDVFTYNVYLELPLPDLGRYELYGTVHLLPPVDLATSRGGPVVRIVP